MKSIARMFEKTSQPRILLVLQESMACWFRVVDRSVVDSFVELVTDDLDQHENRPSWIADSDETEPLRVELVLDTTLDEVDRVSVTKTNNRLVNRYRRFATMKRLRKDYPHSTVYCLPGKYQEHVAAVMHPAHPASWGVWLLRLQSKHVAIHQVCTGTELVARWSRRFNSPVFVIMLAGLYQRHLLVDGGSMVFLRTIALTATSIDKNVAGGEYTRAAVEQSMTYVSSALGLDRDAPLLVSLCGCSVVADDDATTSNRKHLLALDVKHDSLREVVHASADALVAMLLRKPVLYECSSWQDGQIQSVSAEYSEITSNQTPLTSRRAGIARLIRQCVRRLAWQRAMQPDWPLSCSALRFTDALAPSVQHQKVNNHIAMMLKTAVSLVLVAMVALSLAVVHGITSARELHSQRIQIDNIRSSISDVQTTSKKRYKAPWHSANALYLVDQFSSLPPVETQQLLDKIATAVTQVPALSIDHIVWAVLDSDESYDSLAYALSSIGHRQSVKSGHKSEILQLELAGRIAGESLLDRKRQLDEFVVALRAVPGARDVQVIESPADAALSSNMEVRSHESFRLSLRKDQH